MQEADKMMRRAKEMIVGGTSGLAKVTYCRVFLARLSCLNIANSQLPAMN